MEETQEEKPGYYSILPATVRYDENLKANEKLLYSEITALCNKNGYCYATNEYFAKLYEVHKNTISTWINNLKKYGYIGTEILYKNDDKTIEKRIIFLEEFMLREVAKKYCENHQGGINEIIDRYIRNHLDPINENSVENNTSINNKKESKKQKNETSYDEILKEEFNDKDIINIFKEFIKMRKLIKKPLTNYALKRIINKLNKLDTKKEIQIEILNQSITNSWQDIYPLKKEDKEKNISYGGYQEFYD